MKERPSFTLWRITISEIMTSFLGTFLFFFILFLINQVLLFAEDILSRGADLLSVVKLLFYSLPTILAITIPFSILAATLMTSSRQNSDNELLASSSLGIRPLWLYVPFLIIGLAISIGSFCFNEWSIPRAAQGFKNEYAELIKKSAKIELAPYSISKYGDKLLVTGGSEEGSSASRLQDVLIIDQSGGYDSDTVIADDVGIEFSKDSLMAILSMNSLTELKRLNDASAGDFSVTMAKSAEIRIRIREPLMNYSSTAPSEMSLTILAKKIKEKERILDDRIKKKDFQKDTALDRLRLNYDLLAIETQQERSLKTKDSLTSLTLLQNDLISLTNKIKSLENQKINDTSLQIYRLEYEKKLVLPSACFFFALLALPLGIGSKRAGRAAGFGIALLLSVIYWALLFLGQTLGYRQNVNPVFSMWMPNLVMLLATISLWVVRKIKTGHFL